MLSRRAAAVKPPSSTTRTKTVRLVSRSIGSPDYPLSLDNVSSFFGIITPSGSLHHCSLEFAPVHRTARDREEAMSVLSYTSDINSKISLRPSRQAIKRAALALAAAIG